jgi:quinol monooxygenase YgiN
MTTIVTDQDVVTLINVFAVDPERQGQLVDLLVEATRTTMNRLPGYRSANIHRSLDGTKVVNYAQWHQVADFEAMLANPAAQEHMKTAAKLASSFQPHLYEVAFTHQATTPSAEEGPSA